MTTQRQADSNRKNAELSTGPKTAEGKAVSRGNALKHGLSGDGVVVTSEEAAKLKIRIVEWRPSFKKELEGNDPTREFLFQQVVLNSIRMQTAQTREFEIHHDQQQHAFLNWECDRRLKAETIGAELAKQPSLTVAKLENFYQGCEWLISQWTLMKGILKTGEPLTPALVSRLDDLLGISPHFRDNGEVDIQSAISIAESTIERLEGNYLESLQLLNEQDRAAAERGYEREISREERLNRRYEDRVTKRFNDARIELMGSRPEPIEVEPEPLVVEEPVDPDDVDDLDQDEVDRRVEAMIREVELGNYTGRRDEPSGTLGKMNGNMTTGSGHVHSGGQRDASNRGRN